MFRANTFKRRKLCVVHCRCQPRCLPPLPPSLVLSSHSSLLLLLLLPLPLLLLLLLLLPCPGSLEDVLTSSGEYEYSTKTCLNTTSNLSKTEDDIGGCCVFTCSVEIQTTINSPSRTKKYLFQMRLGIILWLPSTAVLQDCKTVLPLKSLCRIVQYIFKSPLITLASSLCEKN